MNDIFQIFRFTIFSNVLHILKCREMHKQKCVEEAAKKCRPDRKKVSAQLNSGHNLYKSARSFIEKVHKEQIRLSKIDHKIVFGSDGTSFDIASYMRFYNTVKLKDPSPKFECYYLDFGSGGFPYILATDKTGSIYKNIKSLYVEFKQSHYFSGFNEINTILESHSAKFCVKTDDTPMGYVQLLHFCEFGDNFSLSWHAASGEKFVVTAREEVLSQAEIWDSDYYEYSPIHSQNHSICPMRESLMNMNDLNNMRHRDFERLRAITDIDLQPIIEMDENYCYVEWIENHTHNGMYRCKYQISRLDCFIKQISKSSIISVTPRFMY